MAYTLQRKMFKLGGSVAHGGGITANLKNPNRKPMKKGGSVTTPIGVGSGNQPMVPGPDGKMREAHAIPFLPLLVPGAATALRLAPRLISGLRSGKGLGALSRFFRVKPTGARGPGTISSGGKASIKNVAENIRKGGGDFSKIKFTPGQRAVTFGDRARQATRIGGAGIAGGAGLGALSSLIPRNTDAETLGGKALDMGRGVTEGVLNLATYLPSTIGQAPFRKPGDIQGTSNLIRSSLYGSSPKNVPQAPTGEVATRQISEMEKLKNQALERKGLYESLMYEPDKLALASNALLAAGTSALRGDELADVIESGFAPINTEAARRREISSASSQQAITDILNDKATRQQILAEVAKSGDTAAIARVKKFFDASDQGVDNALPMNAKGAMDTTQMAAGTIYADIENATGKLFVAVNESGSEIKQFDTIEEAIEHSQKS